jgi:hypothetical protein
MDEKPERVVVKDIDMPFGSMVIFMVKWAVASIPAFIILAVLCFIVVGVFGVFLGGLGGFFGAIDSTQPLRYTSLQTNSTPDQTRYVPSAKSSTITTISERNRPTVHKLTAEKLWENRDLVKKVYNDKVIQVSGIITKMSGNALILDTKVRCEFVGMIAVWAREGFDAKVNGICAGFGADGLILITDCVFED